MFELDNIFGMVVASISMPVDTALVNTTMNYVGAKTV